MFYKICFWMFFGDVVVSDDTGGLISMVFRDLLVSPEEGTS